MKKFINPHIIAIMGFICFNFFPINYAKLLGLDKLDESKNINNINKNDESNNNVFPNNALKFPFPTIPGVVSNVNFFKFI